MMKKPEKKQKARTKKCKHCKKDIPDNAKVCPVCRKKQKGGCLAWVFIAIAALVILSVVAGIGMEEDKSKINLDNRDIVKVEHTDNSNVEDSNVEATPENFISDVKGRIGDNAITDVTLENNNLCIYVDTNANTTTLPVENWATLQAIAITDNILSLSTQYDVLWDTITVDFGEAGKIINSKSDMDVTERCFFDFVLE